MDTYEKEFQKEERTGDDMSGTWKGTENGNSLTFQLSPSGSARAYDKYGSWSGTWRKTGVSSVQIELTTPRVIRYNATISGTTMQGTARNVSTGKSWSFRISRRTTAARKESITPRRSTTSSSSSLVGTNWSGYDHPTGDRFTLYLGSAGRATFTYGRRAITLGWRQNGRQFSVEHINGGWQNGSVSSSSMTTYSNGVRHWTLNRR